MMSALEGGMNSILGTPLWSARGFATVPQILAFRHHRLDIRWNNVQSGKLVKWQFLHTIISTFYYMQIKGDKDSKNVTKLPCGELGKWSR